MRPDAPGDQSPGYETVTPSMGFQPDSSGVVLSPGQFMSGQGDGDPSRLAIHLTR
jgi:hypothetical protein